MGHILRIDVGLVHIDELLLHVGVPILLLEQTQE